MTDQAATTNCTRKIALGLGLGILFLPFVFAWFTLRKGYSKVARTMSLIWLLVAFLFGLIVNVAASLPAKPSTPPQQVTSSPAPVARGASIALPNVSRKAGLGDTFQALEAAWNQGYRKEYDSNGFKTIHVGTENSHIIYETGMFGKTFGNPERVGKIEGETKGLFGASEGANPTLEQFANGIQDLMPGDSKCTSALTRMDGYRTTIYVFRSEALKLAPSIADSFAYKTMKAKPGAFFLIANHVMGDEAKIVNFTLTLGEPVGADTSGMKKVIGRIPFKTN